MKFQPRDPACRSKSVLAFTLVEMMVGIGIGAIVLAGVGAFTLYGVRSYTALENYVDLDATSRNALDLLTKEVRNSTALTGFDTNLTLSVSGHKRLILTNASSAKLVTLTYHPTSCPNNPGKLVMSKTGQPDKTLLTQCDLFAFALFDKAPITASFSTNILFYSATNYTTGQLDQSMCKMLYMTWKCSRQILSQKVNTESVQTAQIVLRNKVY